MRGSLKKMPAQPLNGLIDGLEVLHKLIASEGELSCTQLAAELGMETTRMNRILKTLDYCGLAGRTSSRKYCSGPGIYALAAINMANSKLIRAALIELRELAKEPYTLALGTLWQDKVAYLIYKHQKNKKVLSEYIGTHPLYPASISSIGRILLSQLDDRELREIYKNKTPEGLRNFTELKKILTESRKILYGRLVNDDGTLSIACPIGKALSPAAIAVTELPPYLEKEFVEKIKNLADKINLRIKNEY